MCEDPCWIFLAQDMRGSCEYNNESSYSVQGREFLD